MGIRTIVADAQTFFATHPPVTGAGVVVVYGRKELTKQINQGTGRANRVVVCPPLGRTGGFTTPAAREPGQPIGGGADASGAGKPIGTLSFAYEVHCWAYASPVDENANDDAAIELAFAMIVALRRGAQGGYGTFTLRNGGFTTAPAERRFGSEFTFDYVLQLRIEDLTLPAVVPDEFDVTAKFGPLDGSTEDEDFQVPAA